MKKDDHRRDFLKQLMSRLDDEDMSLIDFDELRAWLAEVVQQLDACQQLSRDHERLREDYIARIAGMMKAIAAARPGESRLQEALVYIGALPSLPVDELISHYRKASARFRDTFPSSFIPPLARTGRPGKDNADDYK